MVYIPCPLLVVVLTSTVNFVATGMKQRYPLEGNSWVIQTTKDFRLHGHGEAGFLED